MRKQHEKCDKKSVWSIPDGLFSVRGQNRSRQVPADRLTEIFKSVEIGRLRRLQEKLELSQCFSSIFLINAEISMAAAPKSK